MNNSEIDRIARLQSAIDINCNPEDFLKSEHVIVPAVIGSGARAYYREPISCNLVSYGSNIVASVKDDYRALVEEYIGRFPFYHCFETPNMHWLDDRLRPLGQRVCFMAEYFLPDMDKLRALPCRYEARLLHREDLARLDAAQWRNALCGDPARPDVLGMGAYDGGHLVGLAACSADCASMWQIGVDVPQGYRRQGIAAALVSRLALEILARGKAPFYCCAWSNIASARTAIKSGFSPAWVEMTVKPESIVAQMNR